MSMSTGQAGYASQGYQSPAGAPQPRAPRETPRAEARAVASLGRRALVSLVDMAIIGAIAGAVGGAAGALIGVDALVTGRVAFGWLLALPAIGIVLLLAYVLMQVTGGSLAQRWFDVRIVRAETGDRIGFGRALARHLIWALGGAIIVGYFSPLFDGSGRQQGWHDKASGTVVADVSASRAAVREVAFGPAAPQQDAYAPAPFDAGRSATSPAASPSQPAPSDPAAWSPAAAAPAAPPPASPHPAPTPPVPDPVAPAAEPIPVDTPAPPAPPATVSHDSFAPPGAGDSEFPDDTIALPARARRSPAASAVAPDAVARDPFAPTGSPAPPQHGADGSETAAPGSDADHPTVPVSADPATIPVPPDDDLVDETIVLGRRPSEHAAPVGHPDAAERDVAADEPASAEEPTAAEWRAPAAPIVPSNALLAGDGFALTIDAGGLSVVRHAQGDEVAVSRAGAALELPMGTPVRLAPGDVLTIGDRSITVGGA